MAVAKHVITVTSEAYDEDQTVRDLVKGLANHLDLVQGDAKNLKVEVIKKKSYYSYRTKITATVTVTADRAEVTPE